MPKRHRKALTFEWKMSIDYLYAKVQTLIDVWLIDYSLFRKNDWS